MGFADTGLGLAWGLLAVWLLAVVLTVSMPALRSRLPDRTGLPVLAGHLDEDVSVSATAPLPSRRSRTCSWTRPTARPGMTAGRSPRPW
jgi:hypothetical protein